MDRQIKFRIWDKIAEEMLKDIYELYHIHIDGKRLEIGGNRLNSLIWDNYIFMQFTGRKDSNGVEIYEGDIVSFMDFSSSVNGDGNDFTNKGLVVYEDYFMSFGVTHREEVDMEEIFDSEEFLTVVGNIYENPDLLKD